MPAAGEPVLIPVGAQVILDVDPPPLAGLTIEGELLFDDKRDVQLSVDWIFLRGSLRAGSAESPFTHQAVITFKADDPEETINTMGTRGLMVMGGRLHLFGTAPDVVWTTLGGHAEAGAETLQLAASVNWSTGDEIVIAPTDFYGEAETERLQITAVSGAEVGISPPLSDFHWGRLQYATPTGLSLEDTGRITPPLEDTPTVLDERAEVASLTRNIIIQGADDALWRDQGFGAHVMFMGLSSEVQIDGVAFRRMGQRGHKARYPIHWHLQSYPQNMDAGDAGDVVRRSTISQSRNRCIVIHGTNGVTLQDNVCFDIEGHGIFLEDAVERRNVIEGNIVLRVRNPAAPLQAHEGRVFQGGSSGFWLTNPDNTIRGNVVADAEGVGFWLAYPRTPLGPSRGVPLIPDHMAFGIFDSNTAHSNNELGLNLDWVPVDEEGRVQPNSYQPTVDMVTGRYDNWQRCKLSRFTTYKHRQGGMWNRVSWPDYEHWVSADNRGTYFGGAGADGLIARSLMVGTSLNTRRPPPDDGMPPVAFATYHSTFDMRHNLVYNFVYIPGVDSGTFRTDDYYYRAVEKGHVRNPQNILINSHTGYRSPRPNSNYALAGAIWDPNGVFGPAERYWTFDEPFLTAGTTCQQVAPEGLNGASCVGPYYGVIGFVLDGANARYQARMPIDVERRDAAGALLGRWVVEDGTLISDFGVMRHFAALRGGEYILRFPGSPLPRDVGFTLDNLHSADDTLMIAVQRTGASGASVYTTTHWNWTVPENAPPNPTKETYVAVGSVGEVRASPGGTFFQDNANNLVWVKIRGGLQPAWVGSTEPTTDERLYNAMHLRVY